ncbi:MAG: superoxide dismutase [Fe] [Candidatus Peribacteria bacterium]|nr:MAG: superoxide dismutase [Fe] [Candidatus Peribacteria bacterium]
MAFELPVLPYDRTALEPHISAETIDFHYGKHHQTYVNNLNNLVGGTDYAEMDLESIIKYADGGIFNNAAQIWNHTFYWNCLAPNGGGTPTGELLEKIEARFTSFEEFKDRFSKAAITNFGSGWTWLVQKEDGTLDIVSTSNADTPLKGKDTPLMTIDVWEHAYYIDYRNARPSYVESFWNLVNWEFVEGNMEE